MINAEHAAFFLTHFVLMIDLTLCQGMTLPKTFGCSGSKGRGIVIVFGTLLSCHRDFCGCGNGKQA